MMVVWEDNIVLMKVENVTLKLYTVVEIGLEIK